MLVVENDERNNYFDDKEEIGLSDDIENKRTNRRINIRNRKMSLLKR